jgi:hypothetical protein
MTTELNRSKPRFSPRKRAFIAMWGQLPFGSVAETAAAVGIKPSTAYDWKRDDQAFCEACEESRNGTVERLIQEAMDGLRGEVPAVMREKIRLATSAKRESVRDSASTWLLEPFCGRNRFDSGCAFGVLKVEMSENCHP